MTSWPQVCMALGAGILLGLAAAFWTGEAQAHYRPGTHNAVHAIQLAWCGKANVSCSGSRAAVTVARCESGPYWDAGRPAQARNGQYLGLFQMGSWERSTFGHGPDPWSQAFAARRYFRASGFDWSPWECQP